MKVYWNLKRANWNLYTSLSDKYLNELGSHCNVDRAFKDICQAIIKCAVQCIPRGRVNKFSPFWSEELQELKIQRDRLRDNFESSRLPSDKAKLQKAATKLKKEIKEAKRKSYRQFVEDLDYRKDGIRAHSFLSKLTKQSEPSRNPPVTTPSGKLLTFNEDIANFFCLHYAKVSNFHIKTQPQENCKRKPATCLNELEDSLFNDNFNLSDLNDAIGRMQHKKSAGPDEILPEFISNLGVRAREVILQFMNKVWSTGIPSEWRKAEIIPIPKKGKLPNHPANCRPIALTSIFSKLFERLLFSRLEIFLEEQKIVSEKQAGFRKHRNTIEQVAYLSQEIKNGFNRKQSSVAVFVDLKAAFDKVWRARLLYKIRELGIAGKMFNSIHSLLSQRFIRVRYNNAVSRYKQTRQGVPQGSVLSPTLFSIMINDAVSALESIPGIRTLLYADDMVVWATSSHLKAIEDCLNKAMIVLHDWVLDNALEVNTLKTVFQVFTLSTKSQRISIKFNNVPLPETDSAVYLGVQLDKKLTWKKHIEKLVYQGEGRLRLLKRLAGISWGAQQDMLALTYKTYIRPAIEYGSEVILTASDSALNALDVVQNKALRLVTGGAKSTPITALEIQTDTEPLQIRREKAAINLLERVKRLKLNHWERQETSALRLKTQKPLTSAIREISEQHGIEMNGRQPLPGILSQKCRFVAEVKLHLLQPVSKSDTPEWELRALALETINTRYPPNEWIHLYTDGSARSANKDAGAGVFCKEFVLSSAVGSFSTNFDGEVKAISMAVAEVSSRPPPLKIVLLVDSQAAITAVASRDCTDLQEVVLVRKGISKLIEEGNRVVCQWVPSHCGLHGNEQADELARQGALKPQPQPPLPLTSAKRIVKSRIKEVCRERHARLAQGKQWSSLLESPLPPNLRRADMVAAFRMATGHDYLQAHLHKINVVNSPTCPLCRIGNMDAQHLTHCPGLEDIANDGLDDLAFHIKLYWVARRRMMLNQ